jgi:MazG family protein
LEETYEVLQTLDLDDAHAHKEELGDLLFQVVFQSRIRSEEPSGFDIADVCNAINDKLVRRHPHVFGPDAAQLKEGSPEQVHARWEQLKRVERGGASVLAGVPPTLPALLRAQRVGEKAARVGFDWRNGREVLAKIKEELLELEHALDAQDTTAVKEEMGDLLFAVAQFARFEGHHAEDALRQSVDKFTRRFQFMENELRLLGRTTERCSMDELERLWRKAKERERAPTVK